MKAVLSIRYFIGFANHINSFTSRCLIKRFFFFFPQIIYASGQSKQEKQNLGSERIEGSIYFVSSDGRMNTRAHITPRPARPAKEHTA